MSQQASPYSHCLQGEDYQRFLALLDQLDNVIGMANTLCPEGKPQVIPDKATERKFFQCHLLLEEVKSQLGSMLYKQAKKSSQAIRVSLSGYHYGLSFDMAKRLDEITGEE